MRRTAHPAANIVRKHWPPDTTILDVLADRTMRADRVAVRARDVHNHWRATTWAEYGRAIAEIAAGLSALGIQRGDRVAILSWNRPEWHTADLGIISLGAVSVPIYPTSAVPQVGYVLRHSGAKACFVEDREQLGRVLEQRDQLPELEHLIFLDECPPLGDGFLYSDDELRALGVQLLAGDPGLVERARRAVALEDVATIVYTSGTTGPPKGAVLTHANVMATLRSVTQIVPLAPTDRFLSFLPLSHITERSVSHFGLIASGGETWFARSISTVAEDLPDCRPTIFFAVPRVWEKFREGIEERIGGLGGMRGVAARYYLSLASRRARDLYTGASAARAVDIGWRALDAIVGRQLRGELGLDQARITVSGAAPIHPDLVGWFNAIGIPLAEGYGQTEVALATTLNPPGANRVGTVGPPLPGVRVHVAEDGEILVQGDNVCAGYWHDHDATRALIDEDGWLHSGDLGRFDEYGYLRITGRKKDLIITAKGKNISPQNLETDLASNPLIGQAVVIGDGRRFLTGLLALDETVVENWARTHDKGTVGLESLARDPDLRAELRDAVEAVNRRHSAVEQIRHWRVLPRPLTVASGELTPTLKVKRAAVNDRYRDLIEEMYAEPAPEPNLATTSGEGS